MFICAQGFGLTRLISVNVEAGAIKTVLTMENAIRVKDLPSACEFRFDGKGDGKFSPKVTLRYQDGTETSYSSSSSLKVHLQI